MPNKYINANLLIQDIERSRSDNNHNNPIASQVHNGEHRHFIKMVLDQPAADVVSRELFEHIKWERDIAMTQLEEHGICFGAKKTGDLVEVRHGYWKDNLNGTFTCSECNGKSSKMDWCGRCGAKMDGERKAQE